MEKPGSEKTVSITGQCICHSGKPFKQCCDRFLNQKKQVRTPEQLMRSRYTAYALGGYGEYLMSTWLPAMTEKLDVTSLSRKDTDWVNLEVLEKSQKGDKATVEFKAWYQEQGEEEPAYMYEKSRFIRIAGKWLYVGKDVTSSNQ